MSLNTIYAKIYHYIPLETKRPFTQKVQATFTTLQERVKTRIFPNVQIQAACHSPPLTTGIRLEPFEWNPCKDGPHGCRNSLLVTGFLVIGSFGGILAIIGVFLLKFMENVHTRPDFLNFVAVISSFHLIPQTTMCEVKQLRKCFPCWVIGYMGANLMGV